MSPLEIIVLLIALVGFSAYLLHQHRERQREWQPEFEPVAQWNGKVLEVENVLPQIERLREDYLSTRRSIAHDAAQRRRLNWVRQSIGRFSYFHRDGDEVLKIKPGLPDER